MRLDSDNCYIVIIIAVTVVIILPFFCFDLIQLSFLLYVITMSTWL